MTKLEIRSRQTDDERERIVRQRDAAELSLQVGFNAAPISFPTNQPTNYPIQTVGLKLYSQLPLNHYS